MKRITKQTLVEIIKKRDSEIEQLKKDFKIDTDRYANAIDDHQCKIDDLMNTINGLEYQMGKKEDDFSELCESLSLVQQDKDKMERKIEIFEMDNANVQIYKDKLLKFLIEKEK